VRLGRRQRVAARLGLHREFSERLRARQGGGDLSAAASAGSAMAAGALPPVASLGVPGCCGDAIVLQPACFAYVVVQAA
jgi:TctA family transporter